MIESILTFTLGFLLASLGTLLLVPAINARANRLARKRAEIMFPLSVSELVEEKDHLRAEFAVVQRRVERKAEEGQAYKHRSMEELGRRAVQIEALQSDLGKRDASIAEIETLLAETRQILSDTETDRDETSASLAKTNASLADLGRAHELLTTQYDETQAALRKAQTDLATTRLDLAALREDVMSLEAKHADLGRQHTEALNAIDAKRILVSDLETRLVIQTSRGDEFERALDNRHGELSEERKRLADLVKNLLAEQERSHMLEERIRELEAERSANASSASLVSETEKAQEEEDRQLRRFIGEIADKILDGAQISPDRGVSPQSKQAPSPSI